MKPNPNESGLSRAELAARRSLLELRRQARKRGYWVVMRKSRAGKQFMLLGPDRNAVEFDGGVYVPLWEIETFINGADFTNQPLWMPFGQSKVSRRKGRKPRRNAVPDIVVKKARGLARRGDPKYAGGGSFRTSPKTGKRRSLREIAAALAEAGHTVLVNGEPSGRPYGAESIKRMLSDK